MLMPKKKIVIIGSGISSLSAGSFLAKEGFDVTILEKNDTTGGRARKFKSDEFVFDMGPSWYWMPDVFERFYQQFGKTTSDFYDLKRLDPSYRIFWQDGDITDVPAEMSKIEEWFEELEPGSAKHLKQFLSEAKYKYEVGMQDLVHKPSLKITEFADTRILKGLVSMHLLKSFTKYTQKHFKHPKILSLLEFPVLFLGAMPKDTPALYSLMNYADLSLGTWYPMGGMHKIIEAFESIAIEQGVKIKVNNEVKSFQYDSKKIKSAISDSGEYSADIFVSGADYHHTDKDLLGEKANYTEKYWDKRTMAPSCLIFYVGVNRRLKNLRHHNLFFDTDFEKHAKEIYEDPTWPSSPLFYTCVPSITDPSVAPEGHENLFFLVPIAPNLKDSEEKREAYFQLLLDRLEQRTGENIRENIVYKRSYCIDDFKNDYHAFKGNAYGLANTLKQTAFLKPKLKNKKIKNMYYTGQLTVPGPGVPPSIISGEVVAKQIMKDLK
jgi:phytoene desaturase|tara:strand:- start:777 stop:2255 length:1479 start_codon:yes stop_codon:yes gene_type:complete